MSNARRTAVAMVCAALLSCMGGAQAPSNPCDGGPFRQFDFWIGTWDVTQRDGSKAGTNRIEKILNGCALQENWEGVGGSVGKSFNQYDWQEKKWKQTWVDGQALRLDLEGGIESGAGGERMVLRGERPNTRGEGTVRSEVSWTLQKDGSVEQHWRTSTDGGETWSDAFFGIYRRVGGGSEQSAEGVQ